MKKIIPSKILLLFIICFVFVIPILGYCFFSLAILLILQQSVPIWYFYLGLITSIIILIFILCSKEQYGIIFKEDSISYCEYSIKKFHDEWELPYNEITRTEYKSKGAIFESRKELTDKNIIVLVIDKYRFKYIDLSLYSNYQSKKILEKLCVKTNTVSEKLPHEGLGLF